jgi:hypothetical protein
MSLGFIILRHVNSEKTNNLWIECYDCIRKFYPLNKILIIDDASDYKFVDTLKSLSNTLIIQSEFKGRGEFLPYYYYLQNKLFDRAVILHDSVFIKQLINFGEENKFLWSFEHTWDRDHDENKLIKYLHKNDIVKKVYDLSFLWKGCFGVMSVLSHDFLCEINTQFNFINLVDHITTRDDRMILERVFAVLFTVCNNYHNKETKSIFGDLHTYSAYGSETYDSYKQNNNITLPIVKVWSGR